MLATEIDIRVRLPEGELTLFLDGGDPPVPTAGEILTAIDGGVTERCEECLPATAHAISFLSYWVGIGRLTTERAAEVINEQNQCIHHLGLAAISG